MASYCGACIDDKGAAESEVIRKRMIYLMGTDVCRINDKKFIERLQERVQDEYDRELLNKERQLAEQERLRQKRLVSDGIVTQEQLREQDSTKWRKQRRMRTPPPGEEQDRKLVQEKARPVTYHDKKDKDKEKGKRKGSKEEENKNTKEDEQKEDNDNQKEKGDEEKQDGDGEENGAEGGDKDGDDGEQVEEQTQEDQTQEQERDDSEGWHCDSDYPNYTARNNDPLIRKLRHQETTDGMYHAANEVLLGEQCGGECEYN